MTFRAWMVAVLRRPLLRRLASLALVAAAAACTDGGEPLAPPRAGTLRLSLQPGSVDQCVATQPVNLVRLRVLALPGREVLLEQTLDVPPSAPQWTFNLDVPVGPGVSSIMVLMELMHRGTTGAPVVQCSGETAPLPVDLERTTQAVPLNIVSGPLDNLSATAVTITTEVPALLEGDSVRLNAVVDGPGSPRVSWQSLDPAVATVDQTGMVRLLRNGSATIVAQVGLLSDRVVITAGQRAASVQIVETGQTAASLGDELQFTARVLDARGAVIPDAAVTWSVADGAVAASLGGGRFRALANGSTTVQATSVSNPAATASAALTVQQQPASVELDPTSFVFTAIGLTTSFGATVLDARDNAISGATVEWTSAQPEIVSVSAAGVATARSRGATELIARSGAVEARAAVQVTQTPASIELSPASLSFSALGEQAALDFAVLDGNGNVIADAAPEWSSSNPDVASVVDGRVTARGNGSATIEASIGDVTGTADVTVQQRAASITLTPAGITSPSIGAEVEFSAVVVDALGAAMSTTGLDWSSSDEAVAISLGNGRFRTTGNGSATIEVTSDGVSGTGTLTVAQQPASVQVSPDSFVFAAAGLSTTFQASVLDAAGTAVAGAAVEWSSSDPDVVVIDDSGVATSTGAGSAQVVARAAGGVQGSAQVTVTSTAASISIEPASLTLAGPGATATLQVSGVDANGAPVAVQPVSWTSADVSIATVDGNGVVTAVAAGSTTITATSGPLSASAPVTVSQPMLTVEPASLTLEFPGTTGQLTATVRDAAGEPIPGAVIVWASADADVATVDAAGLVTAVAPGSTVITASAFGQSVEVQVTVDDFPLPDLRIESISLVPAGNLRVGTPTGVQVVIRNDGAFAAAAAAALTVHDAVTGALLFSGAVPQPEIPGETSTTISGTIVPQASWPSQVYAVITVDAQGTIAEFDESNNATRFPTIGSLQVEPAVGGDYTVVVDPSFGQLAGPGSTLLLTAEVRDPLGNPVPIPVTWASSNPDILSVAEDGTVTATGNGLAAVTASAATGEGAVAGRALILVGEGTVPEGVTTVWLGALTESLYQSWNTPEHWSTGVVPGPDDVVLIPDCATYQLSYCSYPMLDSDVVIAGLRTGWLYEDECDTGLTSSFTGRDGLRLQRPAAVAAMSCYVEGMRTRPSRTRPARAEGQPRAPLVSSAGRESRVSPHAGRATSEYWYHVDVNGHSLTINGAAPDFSLIASGTGGGNVVLGGTGGADVHSQFWVDVLVSGDVDLEDTYILGDLVITGAADVRGWIEEDVDVLNGGSLGISDYLEVVGTLAVSDASVRLELGSLYVSGGVNLWGADSRIDIIDSYFASWGDVEIDSGTLFADENSHIAANTRLIVDGADALLDIASAWIDVGDFATIEYPTGLSTSAARVVEDPAFLVTNGGRFAMRHVYAYLNVAGDIFINGGSTSGLLTHGELYGWRNFTVGSAPFAYAPSGDHITAFGYSYTYQHQVSFAHPGVGEGGSHFHHLETGYGSGLQLLSPAFVTGDAEIYTNTIGITGPEITVFGRLELNDPEQWDVASTILYGVLDIYSGYGTLETDLTMRGSSFLPYDFMLDGDLIIEGASTEVQADYFVDVDGNLTVRDGALLRIKEELDLAGNLTTENGGSIELADVDNAYLEVDGELNLAGGGSGIGGIGRVIAYGAVNAPAGAFASDNFLTLVISGEVEQNVTIDAGNLIHRVELRNDVALTGDLVTGMLDAVGVTVRHTGAGSLRATEANVSSLTLRDHLELHLGAEDVWADINVSNLFFDGYLPGERRLIVRLGGQSVTLNSVEYGTADSPAGEGSALDLFGTGSLEVTSSSTSAAAAGSLVRTRSGQTLIWNGEYLVGSPPGE